MTFIILKTNLKRPSLKVPSIEITMMKYNDQLGLEKQCQSLVIETGTGKK
jgi:hypothetical protein